MAILYGNNIIDMSLPIEQQIEYSFYRLPLEVVVKIFKEQRNKIEKIFANLLSQLVKVDSPEKANIIIEKLQNLKLELNQNNQALQSYMQQLKSRVEAGECSHEIRLQRSLIDYLLRVGYVSTADKLIKTYKLEDFTLIEKALLQEANCILKDLKNKKVDSALKWCRENQSKLSKVQAEWAFEATLHFQVFIEKLKSNQWAAVEYLRENSKNMSMESILKASGCLAVHKNLHLESSYQVYFSEEQWTHIIRQFKQELLNLFCLPTESSLSSAIKCGISSLKTLYCNEPQYQNPSRCPVCNAGIRKLSSQLLMTHKLCSTWICRISGEIMDENNPPMMLPNQQVYSQKSLLANRVNDRVFCPVTKQEFAYSDCIRVYLT